MILFVLILGVSFVSLFLFSVEYFHLQGINSELQSRVERLQERISEEEKRRTELESEAIYIHTKKFIEEKARSMGYIYTSDYGNRLGPKSQEIK